LKTAQLTAKANSLELTRLKSEKTIMQLQQDVTERCSEVETLKLTIEELRDDIAANEAVSLREDYNYLASTQLS
jgi:hypothetical protein